MVLQWCYNGVTMVIQEQRPKTRGKPKRWWEERDKGGRREARVGARARARTAEARARVGLQQG